jgi:hypothetical protein
MRLSGRWAVRVYQAYFRVGAWKPLVNLRPAELPLRHVILQSTSFLSDAE